MVSIRQSIGDCCHRHGIQLLAQPPEISKLASGCIISVTSQPTYRRFVRFSSLLKTRFDQTQSSDSSDIAIAVTGRSVSDRTPRCRTASVRLHDETDIGVKDFLEPIRLERFIG
jgi:hypothetical protein